MVYRKSLNSYFTQILIVTMILMYVAGFVHI